MPWMSWKVELIVCERAYRWTRRLRSLVPMCAAARSAAGESGAVATHVIDGTSAALVIHQVRSLADLECLSIRRPQAVVALEITPLNLISAARQIPDVARRTPLLVGLLDRPLAEFEWVLRDLGLRHVVYGSADFVAMAGLWRRLAAAGTNPAQDSAGEDPFASLPWRRHGSLRQSTKRFVPPRRGSTDDAPDNDPEVNNG